MIRIILYTTAGCHLCELAEALLLQAKQQYSLTIIATEIGDNDELVARYGTTIPVIEFDNGSQLNWPFELDDIIAQIN
ncbi:MAG: hypothetical protein COC04_04305 [Gammaproteobacteria bacterium]|nr:MAG: hypothetical protein COC04_04305 [Gammaproteobacteria bacterium]